MLKIDQAYGVERQLLNHLELAARVPSEVQHHLCALKMSDDIKTELETLNVSFIINSLRTFGELHSFMQYIKTNKIDILHTYSLLRSPFRSRIMPKIVGIPIILEHEHGMVWNMKTTLLGRLTNHLPTLNICNSNAAKIMLKQKCGIQATVVLNGVKSQDKVEHEENVLKLRAEIGVSPQDKIVGFIGRLNTPKGVHAYIRMVPIVREQFPNAKILIVGDGPMRQELEDYAESLGVREDVTFLGFRKDARSIMRLLDVLVVPSIREPFGNVVIEAAFAKKPVVASCVDGLSETIIDGKTGFLVDCTEPVMGSSRKGISGLPSYVVDGRTEKIRPPLLPDTKQLADRVISCLSCPDEAREMGINAYKRARDYFSLERYRNDLDCIYRELVK